MRSECFTVVRLPPRAHDRRTGWNDLSRMKGNFHVRFLGECGRGNPPALTRQPSFTKGTEGLSAKLTPVF